MSADLHLLASALRFLEQRIDDEGRGANQAAASPQHPVLMESSHIENTILYGSASKQSYFISALFVVLFRS